MADTKKYLSMDRETGKTSEQVNMDNENNEFLGTFKIKTGDGTTDIKSKLVTKIKVGGQPFLATTGSDGFAEIELPAQGGGANPAKVFTAVDSSEQGGTDPSELEITPSDAPSTGDVLIVSHQIDEDYTEKTAYVYDGTGWQACDGAVDAGKVIINKNIVLSGNYDHIGNLTKELGGTNPEPLEGGKGTKGVSVLKLIEEMLSKRIQPRVQSRPTSSMTVTYSPNGKQEYGTDVTATVKVNYNDGVYAYDGGDDQPAGCEVSQYNFTVDGVGTSQSSNTKSFQFTAGMTEPKVVKSTVDYNRGTNTPKDNMGEDATSITKIASGTTAEKSVTLSVQSYRASFYKCYSASEKPTDEQLKTLTSNDIRNGYTKTSEKPTSITYTDAAKFVIFVPKTDAQSITRAATPSGLPFTFKKLKNGEQDFTVGISNASGTSSAEYVAWIDEEGANSSDTIEITWG